MPDPAAPTSLPAGLPVRLRVPLRGLRDEIETRLRQAPLDLNEYGYDRTGFHLETAARFLVPAALLYRHWFRVETTGIDRVPPGRVLLVANHSGQFAYDGAMLGVALLLEARPPRLARGMGEYFLWRMPFMGTLAARVGALVGTPENCVAMLEAGECVMVFPEGARGANKPFRRRYQLQRFGQGFMRLALQTQTPIVPVAIIGAEEQQPGLANLEGLGRRLGLPSFPITVTAPWFGPLGMAFALPVKYRIHFGAPLHFEGEPHEEDAAIQARVDVVRNALADLIREGLRRRRSIFF